LLTKIAYQQFVVVEL